MSLDAFMDVPFDYIVYDDSYSRAHFSNFKTEGMSTLIKEVTEAHGGIYKRVPQKFHEDRRCLFPHSLEAVLNRSNPNTRCSDVYQFIQRDQDVYCSQTAVMFLDADIFLVKSYNPVIELSSAAVNLVSVPQIRRFDTKDGFHSNITYMWTALNVMNIPLLPSINEINWDCGKVGRLHDGTELKKEVAIDSGGHTYYWLTKRQPKVKWLDIQFVHESKDSDWQDLARAWKELYRAMAF